MWVRTNNFGAADFVAETCEPAGFPQRAEATRDIERSRYSSSIQRIED